MDDRLTLLEVRLLDTPGTWGILLEKEVTEPPVEAAETTHKQCRDEVISVTKLGLGLTGRPGNVGTTLRLGLGDEDDDAPPSSAPLAVDDPGVTEWASAWG